MGVVVKLRRLGVEPGMVELVAALDLACCSERA